ncbi:MAG: type I-U CRISPR-associated protein Csb2 [Longimicrobiales bacterium]
MSTAIRVRFPAGRYHATPWGSHVNEAALEWPPSPWRVLRSLIAVWHRKVNPAEVAEEDLSRLITLLAGELPRYRLPPAVHTHSRHYMPIREGRADKPKLVFDAFARVSPDEELILEWPGLQLQGLDRDRLSLLLRRLGYLGRAESWVEADLLDADRTGEFNCLPAAPSGLATSGEVLDTVFLPAPVGPDEYREWRDTEVAARNLDRSGLGDRDRQLLATLPERLIDSLRLDTSAVRGEGWSRHPGMRFVPYLRPADTFIPQRTARESAGRGRRPTTVRLILRGKPVIPHGIPLPRIEDAIKIGEATRAAAMYQADRLNGPDPADGVVPPVLSGHGMGEDNVHEHAFYLPEDADGDGRIDHVLIHAEAGLSASAVQALAAIERIWLDREQEWRVIFDATGSTARASGHEALWSHPYLQRAVSWESVTPYLHPWYRKKKFGVEDQVRRECRERGLPEPEVERMDAIRVGGRQRRPVHFHRFRTRGRRRAAQPDTRGSFLRLTFPESVPGPLALGFGCHFGLGIFSAV